MLQVATWTDEHLWQCFGEATELKGDLGIDPCPKSNCVTDTGFALVNYPVSEICAEMKPRMRSPILTHQRYLFRLLNLRTCWRKSLCPPTVRKRARG